MKIKISKGGNCKNIKKDNPNSAIKLPGSKSIKPSTGKPFKLAGATKVIGKSGK